MFYQPFLQRLALYCSKTLQRGAIFSAAALVLVLSAPPPAPAYELPQNVVYYPLTLTLSTDGLICGSFDGHFCHGAEDQFASDFPDSAFPYGGFGGKSGTNCAANRTRTPVIFIHGNGDNAIGWDSPPTGISSSWGSYTAPSRSVYDEFRYRGYGDCDLFGVSYLSATERSVPSNPLSTGTHVYNNHNKTTKYNIILNFINAVKAYTGSDKVDIVAHSLGVSMTIAALKYGDRNGGNAYWGSVRRFVNIAGGIRGLAACSVSGPIYWNAGKNLTCRAESGSWNFGFYPDNWGGYGAANKWTGWNSLQYSLRRAPENHGGTLFYTISAGDRDQVHCPSSVGPAAFSNCHLNDLFWVNEPYWPYYAVPNVKSQVDVGAGPTAYFPDWDFEMDFNPFLNKSGGDLGGVGHFHARSNTGSIIYRMLTSSCSGLNCANHYSGANYGPVQGPY